MKEYKFNKNTSHRFIRVDIDQDLNIENENVLSFEDITALCHEIVSEIVPSSFDRIVDFDSFVILNIKIKSEQDLYGIPMYLTTVGVAMRPLKVRENIDMVDWIGAFFTESITESIIEAPESDRGYMIADLMGLKDRYAWFWTFKYDEIKKTS